MTPERQQIAIGEADGWTWHGDASWPKHPSNYYWKKGRLNYQSLPNYPFDLNAMHEVEKLLTQWEELVSYHSWLGYCGENNTSELHNCIHATASQRAEAFLRTIGKWEESK